MAIAAVWIGSLNGELAMPASSRTLRLTASACLLLAIVLLCTLGPSLAQTPPHFRPDQEPITPVPPAPIQNPRQVALGDRLFHDPRLSHDNTLSCNSCHDVSTNGASAGRPKSRLDTEPELNTPTVFNAAFGGHRVDVDCRDVAGVRVEGDAGRIVFHVVTPAFT